MLQRRMSKINLNISLRFFDCNTEHVLFMIVQLILTWCTNASLFDIVKSLFMYDTMVYQFLNSR